MVFYLVELAWARANALHAAQVMPSYPRMRKAQSSCCSALRRVCCGYCCGCIAHGLICGLMRFAALAVCIHKIQTATWQIQVVQAKLFTYAHDCGPEFTWRFVANTCLAICKSAHGYKQHQTYRHFHAERFALSSCCATQRLSPLRCLAACSQSQLRLTTN